MSFPNPGPLRIGMQGSFAGRRYRIAGRLGLSTVEGGETYRWTEFHLVPESGGESATLVCESGERGLEWRLFTFLEPVKPLSLAEVNQSRVGDRVNLTGTPARITLVGESRVEQIEGTPPEGVEAGDLARFFNAEVAREKLVVSWTGDEIECYRGLDLPVRAVYSGFGMNELPPPPGEDPFRGQGRNRVGVGLLLGASVLAVLMVVAVSRGCRSASSGDSGAALVVVSQVPAAPLRIGASGVLAGQGWEIEAHRVVEVASVNLRFGRNEFLLREAGTGERAWLVCGLGAGAATWYLFTPMAGEPGPDLAPQRAATKRVGDRIEVGAVSASVLSLFRTTVLPSGENAKGWEQGTGTVRYGFTAGTGTNLLLLSWDDGRSEVHLGTPIPAKSVLAAMGSK